MLPASTVLHEPDHGRARYRPSADRGGERHADCARSLGHGRVVHRAGLPEGGPRAQRAPPPGRPRSLFSQRILGSSRGPPRRAHGSARRLWRGGGGGAGRCFSRPPSSCCVSSSVSRTCVALRCTSAAIVGWGKRREQKCSGLEAARALFEVPEIKFWGDYFPERGGEQDVGVAQPAPQA